MRIFLFALLISCAPIIGRHDVPDEEYLDLAERLLVTPAVVRYSATDVAGTLITPVWILSAAHVAETIEPGKKLFACNGDSLEVEEVVLHPGWIENSVDIALIRLAQPVSRVTPARLYTGREELGHEVVVVGHGDVGTGLTGPAPTDGRMRAATNRVDEVTDAHLKWVFDDPGNGKATAMEGISGPGDSGGPAFIRMAGEYLLAGVSSGQSTRATGGNEGLYGVTEYYTRVSSHLAWIRGHIEVK